MDTSSEWVGYTVYLAFTAFTACEKYNTSSTFEESPSEILQGPKLLPVGCHVLIPVWRQQGTKAARYPSQDCRSMLLKIQKKSHLPRAARLLDPILYSVRGPPRAAMFRIPVGCESTMYMRPPAATKVIGVLSRVVLPAQGLGNSRVSPEACAKILNTRNIAARSCDYSHSDDVGSSLKIMYLYLARLSSSVIDRKPSLFS